MSPIPLPLPILSLRLSSPSFLETVLTDNGRPVYSTETYANNTSLYRCDPYSGLTLVANIHWPEQPVKGKGKGTAPAQLLMDGSSISEDELLKHNRLNTARKFRIPGHSHALKWRRAQGGVFQCTSSCGTPVAVFEPAIITARARLNLFVASLAGLPETHGGASPILVDYLIVTALLLLTHPEDWHGLALSQSAAGLHLDIPQSAYHPLASAYGTPVSPITSSVSDHRREPSFTTSSCWDGDRTSSSSSSSSPLDSCPSESKEDMIDYEAPPPYEEIQWTVRIRQPRRQRT